MNLRQVAVSWFPLALLFVVFPLQVFEGNQDSFGFDLLVLAPLLLLGIASLFFMDLLLRLPSETLRLWIAAAGFWVGLCLLLLQVVAPLETNGMAGHFDIEGIYTSGTAALAAILVLSIVIVVALIVPARRVVGPASVFVPLCLVFLVGSSLLHVSDATIQRLAADLTLRRGSPITDLPTPKTPVEGGNVYHIILDAFVASAFPEAMRRAGATPDDFPGFTVFPRNRANYDVTHVSVPSLMSGTLHESSGLKQWQQKWKEDGLLTQAVQTGYTLWLYPAATHYEGQRSHFLRPPSGGGRSTTAWTLFGLALMRASPPTLREWLWQDDSGLVRKAVMAAGFSGNEWVLEQVQRFRNVTADEFRRAGKGEYVYAHIYLPHGPYLLGSDCGARSGAEGDQNNRYLDQAACAVRLLGELIKELRRTNRYDDATILVHADHGVPGIALATGATAEQERAIQLNNVWGQDATSLDQSTAALLLIKPPRNTTSKLTTSMLPTQNLDIAATMRSLLGIPASFGPGYPILAPDFPTDRTLDVFTGFAQPRGDRVIWFGRNINKGLFSHFHWSSRTGWTALPPQPAWMYAPTTPEDLIGDFCREIRNIPATTRLAVVRTSGTRLKLNWQPPPIPGSQRVLLKQSNDWLELALLPRLTTEYAIGDLSSVDSYRVGVQACLAACCSPIEEVLSPAP